LRKKYKTLRKFVKCQKIGSAKIKLIQRSNSKKTASTM